MLEIVVHEVRGKRPVYKKGNKASFIPDTATGRLRKVETFLFRITLRDDTERPETLEMQIF